MTAGVYTIECTANGKLYVGSAVDYGARRRLHLHQLRHGKHHSIKLQRAFNKYGEAALRFCLVHECERDQLVREEQRLIDALRPWFNTAPVAGSKLGQKASEATRKKLRAAHLGRKLSPDHVEKVRAAVVAWAATPEGRQHLRQAALGRKQDDAERAKRAAALTGKRRDDDAKATMRDAQRARRGLVVDEAAVIATFHVAGTVRGTSAATGLGRKLVKNILVRGGLL